MDREAARIRVLVAAHRPSRPTEGYPGWLRAEVAAFATRARRSAKSWMEVGAAVGLPGTTVIRWVGRTTEHTVEQDTAALVEPVSGSSGPAPAVSSAPRPTAPAANLPVASRPSESLPPTSLPAGSSTKSISSLARRSLSGSAPALSPLPRSSATLAVPARGTLPAPVPVVAVPDPAPPSLPGGCGWGPESLGGLWLESPGGFRLHGLDLAGAVALLQALR